ncbi:MAG: hypothetical protein MJ236_01445 [Clostridia bacterium]|nr:hypothetical protein [Clostridia bacterium]
MSVSNKIKYFYNSVNVGNSTTTTKKKVNKTNPHLEFTIPLAAAITLAVSTAIVLPLVLSKNSNQQA